MLPTGLVTWTVCPDTEEINPLALSCPPACRMTVVEAGPADGWAGLSAEPPHAALENTTTPAITSNVGRGRRFGDMVDHVIRNGSGVGVV
ncbi:hypothetical protein OKHIF_42240 [Mycobacteroides chelonae]